ncbi:hypothetical protein I7I53_02358 [Histoplasma capsulatum var. duboisii H88]|uniref:Uncharacterized protein n=1 Tax=Ajellomyces capsulatus (strain H88) TaxID=544711 RepID=A0A8A1LRU6_AJEC8|nr:hypothetical protein I7I53_02358 [Histoplasma capsulatum var. duboisii H88]
MYLKILSPPSPERKKKQKSEGRHGMRIESGCILHISFPGSPPNPSRIFQHHHVQNTALERLQRVSGKKRRKKKKEKRKKKKEKKISGKTYL